MSRTYVALLHEYLEEMEELTDEEFGRLCRGLLRYSATGEAFVPVGNERFFVRHVMAQEDRHQESYERISKVRSEAGKKGMASRWGITNDNNSNHTKTDTKTKSKSKTNSLSSGDEKRREERMRKDILELERFMTETKDMEVAGT